MSGTAPLAKRARTDTPAAVGASTSEFSSSLPVLTEWFARYGADPRLEIEARLREVSQLDFEYIRNKLAGFAGWTSKSEQVSMDVKFASGIRQTLRPGQAAQFLAKSSLLKHDVSFADGNSVRVSVSSEDVCAAPAPGDEVEWCRHKTRYTFCHKEEMLYELTVVRSGRSQEETLSAGARVQWEIELEWCGQKRAALYPSAEFLAQKMTMKMEDLLRLKRAAGAAASVRAAAAGTSLAPAPHLAAAAVLVP